MAEVYASSDTTWSVWTATTTATTSATWNSWIADSGSTACSVTYNVAARPAEEWRRRDREVAEQRERERRLAREQREREREEAKARATELLRAHLTEEQRHMLDEQSAFLVRSEQNRIFRIRNGWSGNVEELDEEGKEIAYYCIHPRIVTPTEDNMLIQKLMLETDEAQFLRIANRTRPIH